MEDEDKSDSESSSIPTGVPMGGALTFLPVNAANAVQSDHKESASDSDSSTPTGLPGGGDNAHLSFVAVDPNNNAPVSPSESSSSSSSVVGLPGSGGTALTFVQTNLNNNGNNDDGDGHHKQAALDESSSDSDSPTPEGLPGGGNQLTFLSANASKEPARVDSENRLNIIAYDEQPDTSASLSMDTGDEASAEEITPKMSMSKTMKAPYAYAHAHHGVPAVAHRKVHSSTLADARKHHEEKMQEQDSAQWDIVYMTSSPLVCGSDFEAQQPKLKPNTPPLRMSRSAQSSDSHSHNNNSSSHNGKSEAASSLMALELLDVSLECEEFMNVLRSSGRELCVAHQTATTGNLIKAMTHKCNVLHYSGHGFPGYLAFEDENSVGDTHMLQDVILNKMVSSGRRLQLQFVFTSACHSEAVGQAFVSVGVPHVVSIDTKFEVSDEGAMTFTKYFYEALLVGRTIRESFDLAKQSVQFITSSAKRDYEKFKLLPKKGNHNVCLFQHLSPGKLINASLCLPPNNLPTAIKPFVGRSVDMRDIMHSFTAKKNQSCRILNLYGDAGVGKSAIAVMAARYLNDRKIYFKNGIYYVNTIKLLARHDARSLQEMLIHVVKQSVAEYKHRMSSADADADMAATISGDANYDKNLSLTSNLRLFCRYGLFIIDDIDQLVVYYKAHGLDVKQELFDVIFKVLLTVSEKIKFIIISKKICNEIFQYNSNSQLTPKTFLLKRLSSTDCSKLFCKLTGGQWRDNDIKENIDIMSILKNNPLQIHELAKLKNQYQCQTLTKLVEVYTFKSKLARKQGLNLNDAASHDSFLKESQRKQERKQLVEQFIVNPSARKVWLQAHGNERCDYHKIFEILQLDFTEYTLSTRKLQEKHLMQCFRELGMNQDLTINIQRFDVFYAWFNGLVRLVSVLADYYNQTHPTVIHGFMSREEAHKVLLRDQRIPVGTFIIRFRYKEPKSVAISYKASTKKVSNVKCDLNPDSTFVCGAKSIPLPRFILKYEALQFLYDATKPIPKEQIFKSATQSMSSDPTSPSWTSASKSWNPSQYRTGTGTGTSTHPQPEHSHPHPHPQQLGPPNNGQRQIRHARFALPKSSTPHASDNHL